MNPRPTRHSRLEVEAAAISRRAIRRLGGHPRPWSYDTHISDENVDQLRNFVESPKAQQAPDARDARIIRRDGEPVANRLRPKHHGAEFVATKIPTIPSDSILDEQNGSAVIQLDCQRYESD